MITTLWATLAYVRVFLIARHRPAMEAVALRQQLAVYKRKQPHPKLNRFDRLFWVVVRRIWTNWSEALILVKPNTVVSWHRAGYRLFWRWRSRRQEGGGRSARLDPPHEKRESDLGRTAHPWRAATTRLRDLRTDRVTLLKSPEAHSGEKQSQPVARLSEQPP